MATKIAEMVDAVFEEVRTKTEALSMKDKKDFWNRFYEKVDEFTENLVEDDDDDEPEPDDEEDDADYDEDFEDEDEDEE